MNRNRQRRQNPDEITTGRLSIRWNRSEESLRKDRELGDGPPFTKAEGGRSSRVRYRITDIVAYEHEHGTTFNRRGRMPKAKPDPTTP